MKTVGIIGGLGPEATAKFYLDLVSACSKQDQQGRPSILIYSVPLPIEVEKECIIDAQNVEKCIPFLIKAARTLEKGGADFLVMPCNSLHVFIKEIREAVNIPVLSIIDETIKNLKTQNIKEVGILATSITINKNLYKNQLNDNGINQVALEGIEQTRLGKIIYNLVIGRHTRSDKQLLKKITEILINKGIKTIILACTDLQLLAPFNHGIKIIDTMQILADAVVREMIE